MAHGDIHAINAVHQLQKPHHVIKVIQRFSNAHEHDVRHRQAGIHLGKQHLVQHFKRLQPPYQTPKGGGAESAAHTAAYLRGNTYGIAVVVAHQYRFHAVSVGQLPQVLDSAVFLGLLLADHHRGVNRILRRQRITQSLGQIGHFLVAAYTFVQPGVDLFCPEGRLAHILKRLGKLCHCH